VNKFYFIFNAILSFQIVDNLCSEISKEINDGSARRAVPLRVTCVRLEIYEAVGARR
jgi:hypothetical protein